VTFAGLVPLCQVPGCPFICKMIRWFPSPALQCCGVVVSLCASGCGQPPLSPSEPTEGAPHFRIGSYNVEIGAEDDPGNLDVVGDIGAEIFALQEVTPAAEARLRVMYAEQYPHQLYQSKGGAGGLALLSRYPLVDLGLRPGPGGWHPAWHVEVAAPMGQLQLLNVHLRSLFSGDGNPLTSFLNTDEDHLAQIRDFTEAIEPGASTIIVGDFNEGVDGVAVRYLEDLGYLNVLPAFRPGQPTWMERSIGDQLEETIDHVLIDASLRPLDAWVERRGQSDHLPVVAHLEPWVW
jgi:endonuclease/exonuclease/phosphatase family metal-dependent hydrolase